MTFTLSNQRPAVLDPVHLLPVTGAYDPLPAIRETLVEPLFEPLPNRTVSLLDDQNQPLTADDILPIFMQTLRGSVDARAESNIKDLLSQGLISYSTQGTLLANEMFANQAGTSQKLPAPGTPGLFYTAATDVVPGAKPLLASQEPQDDAGFFASLAYTFSPETLGFWFLSESSYEDFRVWFDQQVQMLTPGLPSDTQNLLQKFHSLTLTGLTESLILRKNDSDELQDSSFARVLVHLLMQYVQIQTVAQPQAREAGILPFVATELFLPRTLVFVNVEQHARTSATKVEQEWRIINMALNAPVKVLNMNQLSKLTALPRAVAKAAAQAANAKSNAQAKTGRAAKVKFRKQAPSSVDILTGLKRALKRMKEVNRSQNIFKKTKASFVKANRRDPRDFNKPGKMTSQHFLPDLHVYVDTSGSISEVNYQEAVIMLIRLAKKLNINLYFNSFSHVMSQEVLLHTANKSVSEIWREFQKIPKVNGGTEYEQIWRYINTSPRRRERLSLVISDFEWRARTQRVPHPKNLYYAPCGSMDWDHIVHHARGFTKSVEHIEPAIASRLVGVVA